MKDGLLIVKDLEPGIQEVTLNLEALYPDENERNQFEKRFVEFLNSDCLHSEIFKRRNNTVIYRTECIVPKKQDDRPPLLLVFGNPASHSVASGMIFSFERSKQEHRIWKTLSQADILSFSSLPGGELRKTLDELMQLRKTALLDNLSYDSPFRIGLAVFYTMPSPASVKRWGGVKGLRNLFWKKALTRIDEFEKQRIGEIIREFVSPNGAVIAFQKDAYSGIKSSASPDYTLAQAKKGYLAGNCQCNSDVRLFCMPPTRQSRGDLSTRLLQDVRERVLRVS